MTEDDRADLASFDCGTSGKWAEAATEWIHGYDVWDSVKTHGTRVWLFRNNTGVIVGFGSLGITRRKWPPPDGSYSNIMIIPMLGLDLHFQGQPPDRRWRYSHQILGHLRYEAIQTLQEHIQSGRSTLPVLLLYVHQKNAAAIKIYQHFGFTAYPTGRTDEHILMTQRLEVE